MALPVIEKAQTEKQTLLPVQNFVQAAPQKAPSRTKKTARKDLVVPTKNHSREINKNWKVLSSFSYNYFA